MKRVSTFLPNPPWLNKFYKVSSMLDDSGDGRGRGKEAERKAVVEEEELEKVVVRW